MTTYAIQLKCPVCGDYFLEHSNSKLKRCELVLRICSYDKNRTFHIGLDDYVSLDYLGDTTSKEDRKE